MGREIVYCEGCGNNLREPDFEKGGARFVGNAPWCAPCLPPGAVMAALEDLPPPPRSETTRTRKKASTTRLAVPAAAPRRAAAAPAPRRNLPLFLGGFAATLAVATIAIALGSGHPAAPPPEKAVTQAPKEAPDPAAAAPLELERGQAALEGKLREIDGLIRSDPLFERNAEVFRMMEDARRSAGPRAGELERIRTAYEKSFEEAAKRLAEFARTEAGRLAAQDKIDLAVRKCDDYLESFGPAMAAAPVRRLREDLDRRRGH